EGVRLADGQTAEICLGLDAWAADTAVRLERGFMLLIDYGYPAAELYAPTRGGGTLRAYTRQRAHADPFVAIGRQDLTAHVDETDSIGRTAYLPVPYGDGTLPSPGNQGTCRSIGRGAGREPGTRARRAPLLDQPMTPAGLLRPVTPGSPDTPRGRLAARKMPGERRGELSRSYRRISVRVECSCVQKRTQT